MEKIINNVLLREKVQVILRRETIECKLIFTVIEFMDKHSLFKSLALAYNESDIFVVKNDNLLSLKRDNTFSISDVVRSTIKTYTTKEELLNNRIKMPSKENISNWLENYENNISEKLLSKNTVNFRVRKVLITWYPTITYIIHINFKNKFYKSLVYNYNQITVTNEFILEEYKSEYRTFINNIFEGLGELIWI